MAKPGKGGKRGRIAPAAEPATPGVHPSRMDGEAINAILDTLNPRDFVWDLSAGELDPFTMVRTMTSADREEVGIPGEITANGIRYTWTGSYRDYNGHYTSDYQSTIPTVRGEYPTLELVVETVSRGRSRGTSGTGPAWYQFVRNRGADIPGVSRLT